MGRVRPSVLLHVPAQGWLWFRHPVDVFVAQSPTEVGELLRKVRRVVKGGRWAAGFLSYEATPAFDPAFAAHRSLPGVPAAWWGVFDAPERLELPPAAEPPQAELSALEWRPLVSREEHAQAVTEVRSRIADGDTYQVNLTFPLQAALPSDTDPYRLFRHWADGGGPGSRDSGPPPYGAWIDTADTTDSGLAVASASPELFFSLRAGRILARPMKGTSPRGRWLAEDEKRRSELLSEKNRAENLMIADMLRNDLGRVAVPGSVRVTRLFGVETYATVHQLVSEVAARIEPQHDGLDVLRALYPCASITGAPKASTSHIIRQLERHPRGVYTGSAGYFAPDGSAQMNVLIRTASFDRSRRTVRYGTGGGVVWDSSADAEYQEAGTKTRLLLRPAPTHDSDFRLLETMLWRPRSGYFLLEHHLRRLDESARFLGFRCELSRVEKELQQRSSAWSERTRVRLLVARDGSPEVEASSQSCPGRASEYPVCLDDRPVDEEDVFLFHKTTRREVYSQALERHPGVRDVILWNSRGELTESTRANLVVELEGRRLTPPRRCGLLAGTFRQALLDRGSLEERILTAADLARADRVLLVNSVRGFQRAQIVSPDSTALP
ncbi:MAG: chorismate-binding protein [Thermoanaerobaculia bacterium]|nr:chorismate-binding protein [Thermoanaerobaculia bacterium]